MTEEMSMVQYDVVELPSRGIFYPDGRKSLRVAYLNATDENVLAAQNLIQTNQIADELLRRKILDKEFDVATMAEEDKQAVLLFLRNTAFGPLYKVKLYDEGTESEFDYELNLSGVTAKDFTLVPDGHGEYDLSLPQSGARIKFVFLSPQMEKEHKQWEAEYKGPDPVAPTVTKSYERIIREVNGERDPMVVYRFIQQMPIQDSQYLRRYMREHRPGLNLTQEIKLPSGRLVEVTVSFGIEFFRPFYGL